MTSGPVSTGSADGSGVTPALSPGRRISRFSAEIATALGTGALGAAVAGGASEHGVRWGDAGPEPGMFPFAVGLIIIAASVGNLVQAVRTRRAGRLFLDGLQARRIASFFLPIVAFVVVAIWLGLYVATALYLAAVMRLQGGYNLLVAIATGIATAAFFFVVLEVWFKVALLKGPLEAALGLH